MLWLKGSASVIVKPEQEGGIVLSLVSPGNAGTGEISVESAKED